MSKKLTFNEQIRHPKWQEKRLRIFKRDKFKCVSCGSKDRTLHVHHTCYSDGYLWDVEDSELITLCKSCHEKLTEDLRDIKSAISSICKTPNLSEKFILFFGTIVLKNWGEREIIAILDKFHKEYGRNE